MTSLDSPLPPPQRRSRRVWLTLLVLVGMVAAGVVFRLTTNDANNGSAADGGVPSLDVNSNSVVSSEPGVPQLVAPSTTSLTTFVNKDDQTKLSVQQAFARSQDDFYNAASVANADTFDLSASWTAQRLLEIQAFLASLATQGHIMSGKQEMVFRQVDLNGFEATIEVCTLDSHQEVVAATGEPVGSPLNAPLRDGVIAQMVLENGLWKTASFFHDPNPCDGV